MIQQGPCGMGESQATKGIMRHIPKAYQGVHGDRPSLHTGSSLGSHLANKTPSLLIGFTFRYLLKWWGTKTCSLHLKGPANHSAKRRHLHRAFREKHISHFKHTYAIWRGCLSDVPSVRNLSTPVLPQEDGCDGKVTDSDQHQEAPLDPRPLESRTN